MNIPHIITALHAMQPVTASQTKSNVQRHSEKAVNWTLYTGGAAFFVLLGFAAAKMAGAALPDWAIDIALVSGVAAMILPFISLAIGIGASFWSVITFQKESLRSFLIEITHDDAHMDSLLAFQKKELIEVKALLELKINRIKNRLGMFVGGPEKVALFSLAAMGWSTFKEFSSLDRNPPNIPLLGTNLYDILWYTAAFLTGIALGAVMMNRQRQHYLYQVEILDMAIAKKR